MRGSMGSLSFLHVITAVFALGYLAIILEYYIKANKTAISLLLAVVLWVIYFRYSNIPESVNWDRLTHYVGEMSQIIFFLMGAMTLVEIVDSHRGFKIITDKIQTSSKRKLLYTISIMAFLLSAVLDNLTTTILMISLLRKLLPERDERFLLSCIVVVAANAGGAWSPIGDVTTTMLWINSRISSLAVMQNLLIPSLVSLIIPLIIFSPKMKGRFHTKKNKQLETAEEPGARIIFILGVASLVGVPIFKGLTELPPFMGMLLALSILWLVTDWLHHNQNYREHLRVPHILTKIDTSAILFFVGILLSVNVLQEAGLLKNVYETTSAYIHSEFVFVSLIGVFSAIIDNVPLVAATMGMYNLENYPIDSSLWHLIAYAAGTGGSLLIIGSSSGIALMGMEKITFGAYLKLMTLPVLAGFLGGAGIYLLMSKWGLLILA